MRGKAGFAGVLICGALALALPSTAAAADTFYVRTGGTNPACTLATPCGTVSDALVPADAGDTIDIGAGTFTAPAFIDEAVTLDGVGRGLNGSPETNINGRLDLRASITLRDLSVDSASPDSNAILSNLNGAGQTALALDNVYALVTGVDGGNASKSAARIQRTGGGTTSLTVTNSKLETTFDSTGIEGGALWLVSDTGGQVTGSVTDSEVINGTTAQAGITAFHSSVTVTRSDISGPAAIRPGPGHVEVYRSRLTGRREAIGAVPGGMADPNNEVIVRDSLLVTQNGNAASTTGALSFLNSGPAPQLEVTGCTVISRGADDEAGISVTKGTAGTATATVRNTVVTLSGQEAGEADIVASGQSVDLASSAFTTSIGTVTPNASNGNTSAAPGFTNPAADDFTLSPTSPLIDRGNVAFTLPGELDLAGLARVLDGDGSGTAQPDIGAYERPAPLPPGGGGPPVGGGTIIPPRPNLAPVISKARLSNKRFATKRRKGKRRTGRRRRIGTTFRFSLSEAATVRIVLRRGKKKARTLTLRGKQGSNRLRLKGKTLRRLRTGRYTARLIATDAAGARSKTVTLRFTVLRP